MCRTKPDMETSLKISTGPWLVLKIVKELTYHTDDLNLVLSGHQLIITFTKVHQTACYRGKAKNYATNKQSK